MSAAVQNDRSAIRAIDVLDRFGARAGRGFALLYGLALTINLLVGATLKFRSSTAALEADELEYYGLSDQILHHLLEWNARRTLAHPLVIAAIRTVSDNFLFLQAALAAIFSLAPPMLFLVVRRLTGSAAAGLLAGLLLACWPPSIFFGTSLYSESVALPVFLATLLTLPPGSRLAPQAGSRLGPQEPARFGPAILCGMLLGLTTHVRPMYLLFTPFLCLIVLIEERRPAAALRRLAGVAIGFAILILPWSAAMSLHFHRPILVTANGGETLAGGLNPALADAGIRSEAVTGRTVWVGPGKWVSISETGYLTQAELALPYEQKDALLKARTRAWIGSHPGAALMLETRKLAYMWGFYPLGRDGAVMLVLGNLPTIALFLAAIATLLLWPASRVRLARLWLVTLFVSGVALISWGSWRFRQPADAGLIGLVAAGAVHALRRRRAAPIAGPISSAR